MTYFLNAFSLMSPTWVIEDIIIYVIAGAFIFYLLRQYPGRAPYLLLEFGAFVFLYASVYENLAVTIMHYYSYGPSLIMIGNTPLSIPLFEAVVFLGSLTLFERLRLPVWSWPIFAGWFAVIQDLSLDPASVSQIFPVAESVSGRWQWLIVKPGMASMFNEPAFNFTGWMIMMVYAAVCLLLGRWWFKKSGENPIVGVIYPLLGMVGALLLLVSPLSLFLLWLAPVFTQGSVAEWIMLGVYLIAPLALLAILWRKIGHLSFKDAWPLAAPFILFHLSDIVFTIVGAHWNVLWIVLTASIVHTAILLAILLRARSVSAPAETRAPTEDAPALIVEPQSV